MNAYNLHTDHSKAATAAQTSAKNVKTVTFIARTTNLMLRKSPLLVNLRFSHCATNSVLIIHCFNTPLVQIATAAQWLAKNAVLRILVNTVMLTITLFRPKFLMAAQPRTSSSKSAKIHRMSPSYALKTRSKLLDVDAAQL